MITIDRIKKIAGLIFALVVTTVITVGLLWYNGLFLPSFIVWDNCDINVGENLNARVSNKRLTVYDESGNSVFELSSKCKVQNILAADIDNDESEELLVLCWKIGRYGNRRPFWVKHDELKWSQHIFIYNTDDNKITQQWLASDIGQLVKSWSVVNGSVIELTSVEDVKSNWAWISWGLEYVDDNYTGLHKNNYVNKSDDIAESATVNNQSDTEMQNLDEYTSADEARKDANGVDNQDDSMDNNQDLSDKNNSQVDIIMVGDILLHNGVNDACKDEDGSYDYSALFENTKEEIEAADIAIVNQEVIIGGEELGVTGYPSFNAPYEVADALSDAGFDVICHATNHALDRGKKGIVNCVKFWNDNYPEMEVLGISDNEEDSNEICIIEKNGIKIAILNYTYGTNGIAFPKDMPYAVKLLTNSYKDKIREELVYAEENADFTVVCPHWGIEYQLDYSKDQKNWAEFLVDNGADLIIGTHPHVIEPVEWVETENGNKGLCYYSLGNFINWTSGRGKNIANRMLGGMASVTIDLDDEGAFITDYEVKPLVSHLEKGKGGVTTYFLEDYSEEKAEVNEIKRQDGSFSYEYLVDLSERVWGLGDE